MAGRGNIQDTSPIMIARPMFKAVEPQKGIIEGKVTKTPVLASYCANNQKGSINTFLNKYAQNNKEETKRVNKNCEEDFQNDMDESVSVNLKDSEITSNKNFNKLAGKEINTKTHVQKLKSTCVTPNMHNNSSNSQIRKMEFAGLYKKVEFTKK